MVQVRQETMGGVPFVIVKQALPSRSSHFIVSGRWDTLDDDTVLLLRFAQISEKFCLQMGDIVIKLRQLVRKCIRLGLVADSDTASQFLSRQQRGAMAASVPMMEMGGLGREKPEITCNGYSMPIRAVSHITST